jgi:3-hydroxyacyl-[acyl-carrier-protein] dehydratase
MTKWYSLTNINSSAEGKLSASAEVKPDSPWFSGHFPGNPILPGIAQLALVFEAIKQGAADDLRISSVRRVRFKQIVKPDDRLEITVQSISKSPFSYSFRIMLKDEVACSGMMIVNRLEK